MVCPKICGFDVAKRVLLQIENLREELPDSLDENTEIDLFMASWASKQLKAVFANAKLR